MKYLNMASLGASFKAIFFCSLTLISIGAGAFESITVNGAPAVDQNGGANYSVPIELPAGPVGFKPNMSLEYNHRSSNGLIGVGWRIGGLSAITRCGASLAQDGYIKGVNFTSSDRFCLDGQKLFSVDGTYGASGTEYRKEIEDFSRVFSFGSSSGPTDFKVFTKSGMTMSYGLVRGSSLQNVNQVGTLTWALNEVSDLNGNKYVINYYNDTLYGEFFPTSIEYGSAGTTEYTVEFIYGDRLDTIFSVRNSGSYSTNKRLVELKVLKGSTYLYSYKINYQNSRLTGRSIVANIQVISAGPTPQSLQPLKFAWNGGVGAMTTMAAAPPEALSEAKESVAKLVLGDGGNGGTGIMPGDTQWVAGDFNGDGVTDFVQIEQGKPSVMTCFGSPTSLKFSCTHLQLNSYLPVSKVISGDFDGDGVSDIGLFNSTINTGIVCYSNGHGMYSCFSYTIPGKGVLGAGATVSQNNKVVTATQFSAIDINGDGRQDLFQSAPNNSSVQVCSFAERGQQPSCIDRTLPSFSPLNVVLGDFNGDGRTDISYAKANPSYTPGGSAYPVLSSKMMICYTETLGESTCEEKDVLGGTPKPVCTGGVCTGPVFTGDFNGDGISDLVQLDSNGFITIFIATGPGVPLQPLRLSAYPYDLSEAKIMFVGDLNGDGLSDIVHTVPPFSSVSWIQYSNGDGTFSQKEAPNFLESELLAGNFSGASGMSLMGVDRTKTKVNVYNNPYLRYDLLTKISNGIGGEYSFLYKSLTDSTVHKKSSAAVYPSQDIQPALLVVSSTVEEGGDGNKKISGYSYAGARANLQGRGFLGFREVIKTDYANNTIEKNQYSQDWPSVNHLKQSSLFAFDSVSQAHRLIKDTTFQYEYTKYPKGSGSSDPNFVRWMIRNKSSLESLYDLSSGSFLSSSAILNKYDLFGNLVQTKKSIADYQSTDPKKDRPFESTTTLVVENFSGDPNVGAENWYLGRVKSLEVRNIVPRKSALTKLTHFRYDNLHRLTSEHIEPYNKNYFLKTEKTYDSLGNILTETISGSKMSPRQNTYSYSVSGLRRLSSSNSLGQTTTFTYDDFGNRTSSTDANSHSTLWFYDMLGRLRSLERPDGSSAAVLVSLCITECMYGAKYIVSNLESGSLLKSTYYDAFHRIAFEKSFDVSGEPIYSFRQYENSGRLSAVSIPGPSLFGKVKSFFYDSLGRMLTEVYPNGDQKKFTYTGFNIIETNSAGAKKTITKNTLGQLVLVKDDLGSTLTHSYDAFGNLLQTKDANGNTTDYTYDVLGRKVSYKDSNSGTTKYVNNGAGEIIEKIDNKGQSISLTYDDIGRLTNRSTPDLVTNWYYDTAANGKGKLANVVNSNGYSKSITYDVAGRVSGVSNTLDSSSYNMGFTYDPEGRVSVLTYPSGFAVRYEYSSNGNLAKILNNSTNNRIWEMVSQNSNGQPLEEVLGSDVTITKTYDPDLFVLTSVNATPLSGPKIQELTLGYNARGMVTSRTDIINPSLGTSISENFYYDSLDRIFATEGATAESLDYSPYGRIVSKNLVGSYSYGPVGQFPIHGVKDIYGSSLISFAYDGNGNMQSGNNRNISWTSFNKPSSISNANITYNYSYDSNLGRFKTEKSQCKDYLGSPSTNCIKYEVRVGGVHFENEVTGTITTKRSYIYAGVGNPVAIHTMRSDSTSNLHYLHKDHQGSVYAISDESGVAVERLSYDLFGKRRNTDGTPDNSNSIRSEIAEGYTFHEHLDDGDIALINMGGRVFDPKVARFLSPDPVAGLSDNTQGFDRYSYVMNNPVNFSDPSGYFFNINWSDPFKGIRDEIDKAWNNVFTDDVNRIIGYTVAIGLPGPSLLAMNTTTLFQDNFSFAQGDVNNVNTYYVALAAAGVAYATGGYAAGYLGFEAGTLGAVTTGTIVGAGAGGTVGALSYPALGLGTNSEGFAFGAKVGAVAGGIAGSYGGYAVDKYEPQGYDYLNEYLSERAPKEMLKYKNAAGKHMFLPSGTDFHLLLNAVEPYAAGVGGGSMFVDIMYEASVNGKIPDLEYKWTKDFQ